MLFCMFMKLQLRRKKKSNLDEQKNYEFQSLPILIYRRTWGYSSSVDQSVDAESPDTGRSTTPTREYSGGQLWVYSEVRGLHITPVNVNVQIYTECI